MTPMKAPTVPTDKTTGRITQFVWTMTELKNELRYFANDYTVDITMNSSEPGKIWMVFQKGEDGYSD